MMSLPLRIDEYDLRARLFAGVIVTLPLVVAVFTLWPSLRKPTGLGLGAVVEAALLFWMMRIARDQGKRVEARLFTKWGARPTTMLLRWRDGEIDAVTKLRYHQHLATLIGRRLPDEQAELNCPEDADALYESAVRRLIEKRRGKAYRLVFEENCNYGFARNLYGLKTMGIFVYAGVAALLGVAWHTYGHLTESEWMLGVLDIVCFCFLFTCITESSVRRSAYAYAVALLRSCEATSNQRRAATPKETS